ncbi:hypothetical protein H7F51_17470 [Novosphingobium flavum]|uniref:Uncharacterized protein n=1 Tax=Novosphingobium flavum TaxID=1778672 RepID=A0A7X1FUP5_9SPHN|nr:hypothetical protein [Novosphingobium flavum]MBC2667311.1 hypothetical protein [Novosphingobium flavum]
MPTPFPKTTFSLIAAVSLLACSSAGAAEVAADRAAVASSVAAGDGLAATVVAANNRATNLRTTATSIVLLGMESDNLRQSHRKR